MKDKIYPVSCTSAFCGKYSEACQTCPHGPKLEEFKAWIKRTKAIQEDPIWCPSVWTPTIADPKNG